MVNLRACRVPLCLVATFLLVDGFLSFTQLGYSGAVPFWQRLVFVPGSDGTFAQNYQDTWALRVANLNRWKDPFFLDIGAFNGVWCSNTKLLEERGWTGACVEPFPAMFEGRTCQLFPNAMSDTDGKKVDFGGLGQLRQIRGSSSDGVETISFPGLLNRTRSPGFIALVSLDVEGFELQALRRFPWESFEVGAWIIETWGAPQSNHSDFRAKGLELIALLEAHGYRRRPVQNNGVDEYFIRDRWWHPSLAEHKLRQHPKGSHGC